MAIGGGGSIRGRSGQGREAIRSAGGGGGWGLAGGPLIGISGHPV